MCRLLHIRNLSVYKFLRDNNALSLPSLTTVRKCLSTARVKWEFDSRFCASFKNKMACKGMFQCHRILVFKETRVGEETRVHSKSTTCCGFSDFGDGIATGDDLADCGLFFTVGAFSDNY